jgi:hypothetical protein
MHYEPLDPNSLTDKNNVELRDYAFDGSDDTFIKYYNEVAGLAGFSNFRRKCFCGRNAVNWWSSGARRQ